MEIRPYDPDGDREDLWRCKRAFELELGGTDPGKRAAYEGKLTDGYRRRYLDWVDRCVADDPRCVTVAEPGDETGPGGGADETGPGGGADAAAPGPDREGGIAGYAFVLPERLAMVWDAAVLNEIYVGDTHRGTGVADDLVEAALAVARDQDLPLDRMVLDVDRENERARRFYERHGFEGWGEMVAREL